MCLIDLDAADVWDERKRTARKEHKCSCCRRTILPGEAYLVHFSLFEGSVTAQKCCAECERDRAAFAAAHDSMLCIPDFLPDLLAECISEEPETVARWHPMLDRIEASRKAAV